MVTKVTPCIFFLLALLVASASSARNLDEQPDAPMTTPDSPDLAEPVPGLAPVATPAATQPNTSVVDTSATLPSGDPHHTLSFFMHDILGGSNPSARAVTGIVTNPAVNGQHLFAKPNGAVLPLNNGVPSNNGNSGLINNNNIPFLTGLGGSTMSNVFQNNGNNNNGGFSVIGAQLPTRSALQKLMFGTMTVIDDELTEATKSSVAVSQSQLAIMGGTEKYVNAKGFATIKTMPSTNQHATDGMETLLEFAVYVTY
ncbi:hypothetical protein LguiB_009447 [Lonicera macranthoides]